MRRAREREPQTERHKIESECDGKEVQPAPGASRVAAFDALVDGVKTGCLGIRFFLVQIC